MFYMQKIYILKKLEGANIVLNKTSGLNDADNQCICFVQSLIHDAIAELKSDMNL